MSAAARQGGFNRDAMPGWLTYADQHGITVEGLGVWRSILCDFHADDNPSMRVNTETGGWVCMACGAKGGDVLAHHMQRTGVDFVQAARDLGAWVEHGVAAPTTPRRFSARDALSVIALELNVCWVVISDARRGILPNDTDWQRFLAAAGRIGFIASEAAR